jgi:hypothetical protein
MYHKRLVWLFMVLALILGYAAGGSGRVKADFLAQTLSPTAFTYQGRLQEGGQPAQGIYDIRFTLYDSESGGVQLKEVIKENVDVAGGIFSVLLDFGNEAFSNGEARYLEVAVRPGDSGGDFTVLSPRQALTRVPYALYADQAAQAQTVPWSGITGKPGGLEDGDNDTHYTAGNGIALNELELVLDTDFTDSRYDARYGARFWSLTGNAMGSDEAKLGTTDRKSWSMIVNNGVVMSLEPKGDSMVVRYAQDSDSSQAIAIGERYRDNAIVAWGEVSWDDGNSQAQLVDGFGVSNVDCSDFSTYPWATVCAVTLNIQVESGMHLTAHVTPILDAYITTNPTTAAASIVVVDNNAVSFDVYLSEITAGGGLSAGRPAFSFMVTGR